MKARTAVSSATGLILLMGSASAFASPFWVAYEGDDLPERQGWMRYCGDESGSTSGHGAERSVAEGILTSDGLRHPMIWDFAIRRLLTDPAPGEKFVAEWRVAVDPRSDDPDVAVLFARDFSPGYVEFYLGSTQFSIAELGFTYDLGAGGFHTYRFESEDMSSYTLRVDDEITITSTFIDFTVNQSKVAWGDFVQGRASYAQWDYFRYGIVPEPGAVSAILWGICLARRVLRRAA